MARLEDAYWGKAPSEEVPGGTVMPVVYVGQKRKHAESKTVGGNRLSAGEKEKLLKRGRTEELGTSESRAGETGGTSGDGGAKGTTEEGGTDRSSKQVAGSDDLAAVMEEMVMSSQTMK